MELLNDEATMKHQVNEILTERNRLEKILSEPPFSYQVYPSDANFLLVNVAKRMPCIMAREERDRSA